ncbi:MAG: DUF3592 domain-containing protein [Lachnospiraceae bacterium]|nr:DUF3592 domain-containing protein [Lachnospiraceae bacterium]
MDNSLRISAFTVGVILILFGLISIFYLSSLSEQKIERCTEEVRATVVKVKEKGKKENKSQEYVTDIEYEIDDEAYKVRYVLKEYYEVGAKIDVMYNPENTSEYYIPGWDPNGNNNRIIGIISLMTGIVIIAIAGGIITTRTFGDF